MEEQVISLTMEHMPAGTLAIREDGGLVHLHARCRDGGEGLYRAQLYGDEGMFDMGTLLPDGEGGLFLRRSCEKSLLKRAGALPVRRARAVLSFPFESGGAPGSAWRAEAEPARLTSDTVLREYLAAPGAAEGALVRRQGRVTLLALPFGGEEFPLIALFCLARVGRLRGRRCAVFAFDDGGAPVLPPKDFV
ncbi:MAG TPA: hypothetical protein PK597_03075 [Oscillospiraceae bacterium]|nr:hypothetical protein [Oscillospiraceae bacterium]